MKQFLLTLHRPDGARRFHKEICDASTVRLSFTAQCRHCVLQTRECPFTRIDSNGVDPGPLPYFAFLSNDLAAELIRDEIGVNCMIKDTSVDILIRKRCEVAQGVHSQTDFLSCLPAFPSNPEIRREAPICPTMVCAGGEM